jgi:hypothetical protein
MCCVSDFDSSYREFRFLTCVVGFFYKLNDPRSPAAAYCGLGGRRVQRVLDRNPKNVRLSAPLWSSGDQGRSANE